MLPRNVDGRTRADTVRSYLPACAVMLYCTLKVVPYVCVCMVAARRYLPECQRQLESKLKDIFIRVKQLRATSTKADLATLRSACCATHGRQQPHLPTLAPLPLRAPPDVVGFSAASVVSVRVCVCVRSRVYDFAC